MYIDKEQLSRRYSEMDTEELLDLHGQGTWTEEAYTLLEEELQNRKVKVPARPIIDEIMQSQSGFWEAHWNGKKSLSSAYWIVFIMGNVVVLLIAFLISLIFFESIGKTHTNFTYSMLLVLAIFTPYFVFSSISVWRCSNNVGWKGWSFIVRAIVVLSVLRYILIVTGNA